MQTQHKQGVGALLLCALLWSTGGILIKLVTWHPVAIAGVRSLIAFFVMAIFLRRLPFKFSLDQVLGAIFYALTMILFVFANKMTTAANAILLQYTNPIYIIIFSPLLLKERTDWIDYLTVAGVFVGMLLFFMEGLKFSLSLGNIIALLSGVSFGFAILFLRRQKNAQPEDSFMVAHLITFIFSIPFLFKAGMPDVKSSVGLLLLGIFQIGAPSILYSIGIIHVTAVSAVLITMLEPLMNPIWVLLFYNEKPSLQAVVGGALILCFIFLRVFLKNRVSTYKRSYRSK